MNVTDGSGGSFLNATAADNLTTFVQSIVSIVNAIGYDGVDIDWEINMVSPAARKQMAAFLSALRSALGSSRLLTADAVVNDYSFWSKHYLGLDRINFMVYDLGGNWNSYSWFNAAIYSDPCDCVWSLDLAKRKAIASGIPAGKMTFGIPFYGYVSTAGGVTGPRQSNSGKPSLAQATYGSLLSSYSNRMASPSLDGVANVPWFSIPGGWVTYDNPASITAKLNYVKANKLGGWHIFSINKDGPEGPLAAAVSAGLAKGCAATADIPNRPVCSSISKQSATRQMRSLNSNAPKGNSMP